MSSQRATVDARLSCTRSLTLSLFLSLFCRHATRRAVLDSFDFLTLFRPFSLFFLSQGAPCAKHRVREVRKPSAATSASSSSLEAVQTSGTALQTNQPSLHKAFVADDRPKREVGGAGGSSERSPKKTRHGVVGSGADCRVSAQPRPIQSQPINTSPVPPPRHMQLPAASHPSLAAPSNGLR